MAVAPSRGSSGATPDSAELFERWRERKTTVKRETS